MKNIKELIKKNKKKALAVAVLSVFTATMSSTLIGCNYYEEDDDDDDEDNVSTGGGTSYWHSFNSGSSGTKGGSSKAKISSGSKSSGYSGAKGGFSS